MKAGRLRTIVSLEQRVETTQNEFGEIEPTWSRMYYRHATVAPLSGREYIQAQAVNAEVTHQVTLRADTETLELTPKWRIGIEGTDRVFVVLAVRNINERSRELVVMAKEVIGG